MHRIIKSKPKPDRSNQFRPSWFFPAAFLLFFIVITLFTSTFFLSLSICNLLSCLHCAASNNTIWHTVCPVNGFNEMRVHLIDIPYFFTFVCRQILYFWCFFIELERGSDTANVLDRLIFTVLLLLLLLLLFVFIHNFLRIATIQSMPTYVIMLEPKQENLNKYLKRLTWCCCWCVSFYDKHTHLHIPWRKKTIIVNMLNTPFAMDTFRKLIIDLSWFVIRIFEQK